MDTAANSKIPVLQGVIILAICVLWPVVDFGVGNMSDQDFKPLRLLSYSAVFLAIGAAIAYALYFALKRKSLGLAFFIAGAGMFLTLNYYLIAEQLEKIPGLGNYALAGLGVYFLLLGLIVTLLLWRKTQPAVPVIAIAMMFGLGVMTLYNGSVLFHHVAFTEAGRDSLKAEKQRSDRWPMEASELSKNKHYRGDADQKPPNIYYIIPDMFMGENEYKRMAGAPYAMDEMLEERGFEVLDNYYANAPITRLSLAHVFGRKYFANAKTTLTTDSIRALPWRRDNDITKELRRRGYSIFYYVDTYVNPDCDSLADYCFKKDSFFDAQDLIFMERTPLFDVMSASGSDLAAVWRRLMRYPYRFEIPEVLNSLPEAGASPYFAYLHFGLPHSPYRFDENCNYYDAYPPIRVNKFKGSVAAYAKQVQCAEKMYPRLIDRILEKDPNAWIIFQADHGVNYRGQAKGGDIMKLNANAIGQNLSIIGAYKLPDDCLSKFPEDMSPVNTFRIIFACIDGSEPRLLPARYYLMYYISWQPSGQVRDVTNVIRRRAEHVN